MYKGFSLVRVSSFAALALSLLSFAAPSHADTSIYWETDFSAETPAQSAPAPRKSTAPVKKTASIKTVAKAAASDNGYSDYRRYLPASKATRKAPASCDQMERQILDLVNGERTRRGLRPLVLDSRLGRAGRNHSEDMSVRNYFDHFSPEGNSVSDRVLSLGAEFSTLGENIAQDFSVTGAHNSLMKSPGHRANILKSGYERCGIGVAVTNQGDIFVTQVFAS